MACDIQIVNPSVLNRIESYMADVSYREAIENSANYNTRLCIERRLRMPFLDSQTGVAQNHSNLFMSSRERIPGLQFGQVYTYPSKRWRKKRRQYLMQPQVRRCGDLGGLPGGGNSSGLGDNSDLHTISTMENPAAAPSEDSKDSAGIKDDSSTKASQDAWYYDELELQAMEGFDDPDPDSDYDYEETYSKRRKRRGGGGKPGRGASPADSGVAKKTGKGTGVGRGRKKVMNYSEMGDSEKPFSCDLCGARYKTRPGLTYHYTHSHKDGRCGPPSTPVASASSSSSSTSQLTPSSGVIPSTVTSSSSSSSSSVVPPPLDQDDDAALPPPSPALLQSVTGPDTNHPTQGWTKLHDSYLTYLNTPGGPGRRGRQSAPSATQPAPPPVVPPPVEQQSEPQIPPPAVPMVPQTTATPTTTTTPEKKSVPQAAPMPEQILIMEQNEKERAVPSPYCDFCLGDAVSNKKSGQPEELLSCSDCGRSGHPTCLQFTDNMIVSVRKYRWQCIECKCCSICGTSDNDDQLLFCDDCDRGYHMYCLAPPLHTPPEGSWSCRLCIREFHSK